MAVVTSPGKSGIAGYNDVTLIASLVSLAFHSVLLEAGHIREQLSLYFICNRITLGTSYFDTSSYTVYLVSILYCLAEGIGRNGGTADGFNSLQSGILADILVHEGMFRYLGTQTLGFVVLQYLGTRNQAIGIDADHDLEHTTIALCLSGYYITCTVVGFVDIYAAFRLSPTVIW